MDRQRQPQGPLRGPSGWEESGDRAQTNFLSKPNNCTAGGAGMRPGCQAKLSALSTHLLCELGKSVNLSEHQLSYFRGR